MNRLFAVIFAGMTALAGVTTATNTGIQDSSFEQQTGAQSVRLGSARSRLPSFGGGSGGK